MNEDTLVTEEQAKKKWCPYARVLAVRQEASMNRRMNKEIIEESTCIGSACMAWRWGTKTEIGTAKYPPGREDEKVAINWTPESKTYGYCGAFGRPE